MTRDDLADLVRDMRAAQKRPIEGFPGYLIGDDGSIWTNKRSHGVGPWRRRKPVVRRSGHLFVGLVGKGRSRMVGVHTLVLEAFVGPRPEGLCCRHLNGDPADNRLANLAWGTYQENSDDAKRHGTWAHGRRIARAKLTEELVATLRRRVRAGEPLKRLAREFRVRDYTIKLAVEGDTWRHVPEPPALPEDRVAFRYGRLSPSDVTAIRGRLAEGEKQAAIAADYGVASSTVSRIATGRQWRE